MWNVKTKLKLVIIGATGTIWKSFIQYLTNILGKHDIKELKKTAILGTAHKLRKVLMKQFVCLFSCRYNPLWLYFHRPVAGFSRLVFEVS